MNKIVKGAMLAFLLGATVSMTGCVTTGDGCKEGCTKECCAKKCKEGCKKECCAK